MRLERTEIARVFFMRNRFKYKQLKGDLDSDRCNVYRHTALPCRERDTSPG
jgi:hypothetical protein